MKRATCGAWARTIAPLVVAWGMVLACPSGPEARAQEPAPAGEESKGDPVPGYLGVLLLCMGVSFVVGKSARR